MHDLPYPLPPTSTVLICDERPQARQELTALLTSGAAPFRVTTTPDADGMIRQFGHTPADVVMISVQDRTGFTSMTLLLDPHPSALVIVYGQVQDTALLTSALASGARGMLIWDIGYRHHFVTPRPGGSPGHRAAVALTDRELQILKGMSLGRSNSTIGREIYISEDTVKTHARRMFTKIGALDRAHAVALGLRSGLI